MEDKRIKRIDDDFEQALKKMLKINKNSQPLSRAEVGVRGAPHDDLYSLAPLNSPPAWKVRCGTNTTASTNKAFVKGGDTVKFPGTATKGMNESEATKKTTWQ